MSGFTPGPWAPLINSVVSLESGIESIMMDGGCAQVRSCNSKADAHLIAAAPDLYAALEALCATLNGNGFATGHADRALAKARGEPA